MEVGHIPYLVRSPFSGTNSSLTGVILHGRFVFMNVFCGLPFEYFNFFFLPRGTQDLKFSDQGWNLYSLQWKHGVPAHWTVREIPNALTFGNWDRIYKCEVRVSLKGNNYSVTYDRCMLCIHAKSLQLYLTLCDPMDRNAPGSCVLWNL